MRLKLKPSFLMDITFLRVPFTFHITTRYSLWSVFYTALLKVMKILTVLRLQHFLQDWKMKHEIIGKALAANFQVVASLTFYKKDRQDILKKVSSHLIHGMFNSLDNLFRHVNCLLG